ncbi:MAG TPA: ABC transporter permease [Thermoanaerobaculia bacterium]|nr:ABC transporter permease [Thermoanaerobaculia bacterium]
MNKMFAVMKREYLQAVRKKSFIIMTLLLPFLMAALLAVPGLIMAKGMGKKRIAVLDGTGRLESAFARPNEPPKEEQTDAAGAARNAVMQRNRPPQLPSQMTVEYVNQSQSANFDEAAKPYLKRLTARDDAADKLEGVFLIPKTAVADAETRMSYYSRSATDFMTQERLTRMANRSLHRMRLAANGIDPAVVDTLLQDLPVEAVQLSRSGERKKGGELNFAMAFLFGAMLILPSLVYGQETMRGIVQEKTDRVVEVLVSSVSPMQLLTGKIVGVAAVGLTQIVVWVTMVGLIGAFAGTTLAMADAPINLSQFIRPIIGFYFFVFYILAYLTYVCVYAIGGAICNSEKEAQQFMMPIMMLMMAPWFLMMPIVMNPEAPFAIGFSLAPVFGPITMFVRATVTDPPLWHFLVSIGLSILTILAFFWVTAKIFRIGILSYGKRPTIPELMRWVRVA